MNKKRILGVLLAAGILLALVLTGCTGSTGDTTTTDPTADANQPSVSYPETDPNKLLIVGFDAGFPPMGFKEGGEYVGFDLDLAKEVAKRIGYTYKEQEVVWKNMPSDMEAGLINVVWNGFTKNVEREANFELTKPYMLNKQVIMVKADSAYQKLTDLEGKTVAIQNGSTAEDASAAKKIKKADGNEVTFTEFVNFIKPENNEKARTELDTGGAEAVALDSIVADYMIKKNPGKYRLLDEIIAEEEFVIGFKKGNTELRDLVQGALDAMVADGTFAKISQEWFGQDVSIKS